MVITATTTEAISESENYHNFDEYGNPSIDTRTSNSGSSFMQNEEEEETTSADIPPGFNLLIFSYYFQDHGQDGSSL